MKIKIVSNDIYGRMVHTMEDLKEQVYEKNCTNCKYAFYALDEDPCNKCTDNNGHCYWTAPEEGEKEKPYSHQAEREYTDLVEHFSDAVIAYGITKFNEGYSEGYNDCKSEYENEWRKAYNSGYEYGYEKAKQDILDSLKRKEK